jgi:hypothetical protein
MFLADAEDKATYYPKIEAALALIEQYDPRRFRRLRRDIVSFSLTEQPLDAAQWLDDLRMCQLSRPYVARATTTPADVAATIVHEATHARLFRAGIGYEERIRPRVEQLCFEAEIAFAERLPDGAPLIERARHQLQRTPEFWSTQSRRERDLSALRDLGCPEWLVSVLAWVVRRRAA